MSRSPVDVPSNSTDGDVNDAKFKRYQSGWSQLDELLRNGGSLSGRERNCCFLNLGSTGASTFADISNVSGFDLPVDGRAIALVDWDHDGDVDIWTSNRTAPRVQFFRNDSPTRHRYVSIRLQGTESNRDAIGARVEVVAEPSVGIVSRTVTAGDGYLSQSSKWLHFGLGDAERIISVRVRWPGSREFTPVEGVTIGGAFVVTEGTERAVGSCLLYTSDAADE